MGSRVTLGCRYWLAILKTPSKAQSVAPLILLWVVALAPSALAEDWYRFRGPQLNGISTETEWSHAWHDDTPQEVWQVEVGTGLAGVVVSDGRAFTLGNVDNADTICCFNSVTGQPLWQHSYPAATDPNEFEGGPTSTPTVDGSRLYALSRQGDLFCLEVATGKIEWQCQVAELADVRVPTWGFAGSPLVHDQLLLLNVGDAGVGLNKHTGALVWSSADRDAGYSSMVPLRVSDQPAVVFGSARSYVCVRADSGQELWRQRWLTTFGCNAADPIVAGSQIFISSGYNRGCALLQLTDQGVDEVWKNKELQTQISSCVLIGGHVYGIHGDVADGTQLRCLELNSGAVKWTETDFRPGGLSAAGERLLVLSDDGELLIVAAQPDACQILARQHVLEGKCWTAPVLANGQVYCRSASGQVVCLRLAPLIP